MTEKEKMKRQMLYFANDAELAAERLKAKSLCHIFNGLHPADTAQQTLLLKKLFGKIKGSISIMPPFWCDYGYNIETGSDFFANHDCVILDCGKVVFGSHVFIGPHCGFYTAGHPVDAQQRNAGLEYARPITVGDNVWIGAGVHIMPGVTVGSNVVIGGGSIVIRSIPDNVVAAGNPCRIIKKIDAFDNIHME